MKNKALFDQALPQKFWDQYIKNLHDQQVKEKAIPWIIKRAEQYLRFLDHKPWREHTQDDAISYLQKALNSSTLATFQIHQIIDAIQNLYFTLNISWYSKIDWYHYKASCQVLGSDHATLAREMPPRQIHAHSKNSGNLHPHPINLRQRSKSPSCQT